MTEPRTYDVSTDSGIPDGHTISPPVAAPSNGHHYDVPDIGGSTLDLLREAVEEQNAEDIDAVAVMVPGNVIRLWCNTDIPAKQLQRWQRKALPAVARKRSGTPDLSQMDQRILSTSVLAETAEKVEVRNRATGEWQPIVDQHTGEPLTFADTALLNSLGAMDATTALVKMFRRDSALAKAGQQVLQAAGWAEREDDGAEDDAEDPTD